MGLLLKIEPELSTGQPYEKLAFTHFEIDYVKFLMDYVTFEMD